MSRIRPLAICLFSHNEKNLVSEERDPSKGETFYRPLGGGIESGEHVRDLVYLGTLENIFTFNGIPGHEIVQVYDGALVEFGLYEQAVISGHEAGVNQSMKVVWKGPDEFGPDKSILYPEGLLELLRQ